LRQNTDIFNVFILFLQCRNSNGTDGTNQHECYKCYKRNFFVIFVFFIRAICVLHFWRYSRSRIGTPTPFPAGGLSCTIAYLVSA
jgi:hypothetical protein